MKFKRQELRTLNGCDGCARICQWNRPVTWNPDDTSTRYKCNKTVMQLQIEEDIRIIRQELRSWRDLIQGRVVI